MKREMIRKIIVTSGKNHDTWRAHMKVGKIIDNTWEIIEIANHGGQAQIYKVKNITKPNDSLYALKFLHSQNDSERRQRMYVEVCNLNSLTNDHILKIIFSNAEKYQSSEKLYYVCPYIEGCNLEKLTNLNTFNFSQIIGFILQLLNTVNYCHEKNIIHRDIKPDNIMFENNSLNDFILIDFGLSFNTEFENINLTTLNQQLGNRFLLLPELVCGAPYEKRLFQSDITQCCGILFYLLTKKIPHTLKDANNLAPHRRNGNSSLIFSQIENQNVYNNLMTILDKGFSYEITQRYQSINELIHDLTTLTEIKVNFLGGTSMQNSFMPTNVNIKYSELIAQLNPCTEICNPSGLQLPLITNVPELVNLGIALKLSDQQKIVKYYRDGDFATAAEKIWPRSISILRKRILSLGEEFVADMVETDDLDYVRDLPAYKVICLANDLGFIDNAGRRKLLSANEYYNYFLNTDKDIDEEMPQDEANIIIKSCISYILYSNDDTFGLQFNDFREKLKTVRITEIFDDDETMFATCPYFYLKTTVRSLIKLLKETEGIEFENININLNLIIPQIWKRLKTEEKRAFADAYTDCVNSNDYIRTDALNKILLKVQGFDYVKENIRSRTFISVANKLIDTHFGVNNFYNEPGIIQTLENLGTKFPKPALKNCITAVLYVKLGNSYNTSWSAETVADRLLNRLTTDEWILYLDRYIKEETDLLDSIHGPNKVSRMYSQWKLVVKTYKLKSLSITDPIAKQILS